MPRRQRGIPQALCPGLAHHLDLRRVRRRGGLRETAGTAGGPDCECDRHRRQPVGRHRRESARAPPRMSASATRRATACSRHCWRRKAIRPRRGPSRGRSAGRAPWAMSPILGACWRSRQDLGDREEHLQALSGGHCVSCRDRRLLQFAGELEPAASTRSPPSRCRARRCCWRAATGRFATSATRGSAFIIARPVRCCWAWPALPNFRGRDRVSAGHRVACARR